MKKIEGKVLASGESGNSHVLDKSEVFEFENGIRMFDGRVENILTHEEHKQITIPRIGGDYLSGKVLEYDHFTEESKEIDD
ncbi:hypothetical protein IT412_00790 [Candidatus Peregrinibacteria bacterium]|nr:hypothetical protein [Candidatus Peregrinibacteria bacterium]